MSIVVRVALSFARRARHFAPLVILSAGAISAPAALASETTTVWTNPDGGAWSDPANWSDGVPGVGDLVVLPDLGPDGYLIDLGGQRSIGTCQALGMGVTLAGGSLQCSESVLVGDADGASLRLLNAIASGAEVRVGTDGAVGSLQVEGASFLLGNAFVLGDPVGGEGDGFCAVKAGARLIFTTAALRANGTLEVEAAPGGLPALSATTIALGGQLQITLAPSYAPPAPGQWLLQSNFPMTGAFSSTMLPAYDGITLRLVAASTAVSLDSFDPFVSFAVLTDLDPAYVGFEHPLVTRGTRFSGIVETLTATTDFDLSQGEMSAVIIDDAFIPTDTGSFVVRATVTIENQVLEAERLFAALTWTSSSLQRIDRAADGTPGNFKLAVDDFLADSAPEMTPDGRYVAFVSFATNLVGTDPDPTRANVFVKDRWTGDIEQMDGDLPLPPLSNVSSFGVSISDDGRYVVFGRSIAGPPSTSMIWLRDRHEGSVIPLCLNGAGQAVLGSAFGPRISADGSTVVYATTKAGLVPGLNSGFSQIFAYDIASGQTTLVSQASDGSPANGGCSSPSVSCDGRFVVYRTAANNLVPGLSGGAAIVLRDRWKSVNERVDVGAEEVANMNSDDPSISCDGRFVVFTSAADNLGAPADFLFDDCFLRDRVLGTTVFVSPAPEGAPPNLHFRRGRVSDSGTHVVYQVDSPLVLGVRTIRYSVETGVVEDVGVTPWGEPADPPSGVSSLSCHCDLSADGQRVLFVAHPAGLLANEPLEEPYGEFRLALLIRNFAPSEPADLNNDGVVNAADLALLLGVWGSPGGPADLDGDGTVGAGDLAVLVGAWTN